MRLKMIPAFLLAMMICLAAPGTAFAAMVNVTFRYTPSRPTESVYLSGSFKGWNSSHAAGRNAACSGGQF